MTRQVTCEHQPVAAVILHADRREMIPPASEPVREQAGGTTKWLLAECDTPTAGRRSVRGILA